MGTTAGDEYLCSVDEYYDQVVGSCGRCSDICNSKSLSDCRHYCRDYFYRHLSTTAEQPLAPASQEISLNIFIIAVASVLALILTSVVVVAVCCKIHRSRKQKAARGRETSGKPAGGKKRRRNRPMGIHHQHSIQETVDPNNQEDMQMSILYVSPCSSLLATSQHSSLAFDLGAAVDVKNPILFNSVLAREQLSTCLQDRLMQTLSLTVSPKDIHSVSELHETQPKLLYDADGRHSHDSDSLATNPKEIDLRQDNDQAEYADCCIKEHNSTKHENFIRRSLCFPVQESYTPDLYGERQLYKN